MANHTLTVTFTTDATGADLARLRKMLSEDIDVTLFSDYGPDAWGGYDGPKITDIRTRYVVFSDPDNGSDIREA